MGVVTTVSDLRERARRRIPRAIFEYADCGSYNETTLRANRADLDAIGLRQRVLIDVDNRNLSSSFVGEPSTMPVAIAPTGLTGLFHRDGEIHGARAAQKFGIPFCLSTMSICSIEDVRAAVDKPFWFQLYVMRDKEFAGALIDRAKAANCSALVLTLDLQILGQRHKDIRNQLTAPPKLTPGTVMQFATRPRWCSRSRSSLPSPTTATTTTARR